MNPILIALIVIVCIVIAFSLIAAYVTFRMAFYNSEKEDDPHRVPDGVQYEYLKENIKNLVDKTLAIPYEPVEITSRDGLKLFGRFYKTSYDAPVAILMHGWHGIAERDFAGGVQNHLEKGTNVLLVDERAHNKSEGRIMTFGIKERYDCLDWIEYALNRCGSDTKIIIHGVSMGAATVMMTAGLKLPPNVIGIIEDCGYTSPKEIICEVVRKKGVPPKLAYPFIKLGARLFAHIDLESSSASEAMANNKIPVLFIHGTADMFVPYEMMERLYALTKGPKFKVSVQNASHVMAYLTDTELYMRIFNEFYKFILNTD